MDMWTPFAAIIAAAPSCLTMPQFLKKTLLLTAILFSFINVAHSQSKADEGKRQYTNQFPSGSEHLVMPPILAFSVFMGNIKYPHLPMLLESMRLNPMVQFVIIHVVTQEEDVKSALQIEAMCAMMAVSNLRIKSLSLSDMSSRVHDRLGINATISSGWYYKLCDYKPTLAHLFPEIVSERDYKFWGYVDMDVVWGNFSRFSHWFQGDFAIVISGWMGTTGAAAFYKNENWTRTLFMEDGMYISLLADKGYHNLDEGGTQTEAQLVVDRGSHSISEIQKRAMRQRGFAMNRAKVWRDHCFLDPGDSGDWAGPVLWYRGALKVVHGSTEFPPGRELLFYHRAQQQLELGTEPPLREQIYEDMIRYGYLLPSWTPLHTRHTCRGAGLSRGSAMRALEDYAPYHKSCSQPS